MTTAKCKKLLVFGRTSVYLANKLYIIQKYLKNYNEFTKKVYFSFFFKDFFKKKNYADDTMISKFLHSVLHTFAYSTYEWLMD